jgi:hypothetical protein
MNGFDDFDTTITAEEFYEADYLDLIEEAPGDTADEPPYAEADYDDLAFEYDSGSPIDTDRMERESAWMYGHDLDGYEYAGFDG